MNNPTKFSNQEMLDEHICLIFGHKRNCLPSEFTWELTLQWDILRLTLIWCVIIECKYYHKNQLFFLLWTKKRTIKSSSMTIRHRSCTNNRPFTLWNHFSSKSSNLISQFIFFYSFIFLLLLAIHSLCFSSFWWID